VPLCLRQHIDDCGQLIPYSDELLSIHRAGSTAAGLPAGPPG
jgi:hypothetical protein